MNFPGFPGFCDTGSAAVAENAPPHPAPGTGRMGPPYSGFIGAVRPPLLPWIYTRCKYIQDSQGPSKADRTWESHIQDTPPNLQAVEFLRGVLKGAR